MTYDILTKPASRITGREKVSGSATYAGDVRPSGQLYGHLLTSDVPKGRILGIDTAEAEALPGVLAVLTHETIGDYPELECFYEGGLGQAGFWPMRGTEIEYAGQIVAYVVAETLEAARHAAALVRVEYEEAPAAATLEQSDAEPRAVDALEQVEGDAEGALREAVHTVEAEYVTPIQHHNPMERFGTIAEWRGDNLYVWLPSQAVTTTQHALARQLDLPPERVTVTSSFVGGAFGSKATVAAYTTLTALAARKVGRPVNLEVTRKQMYTVASFRPETIQRVALGCDAEGRLTAYTHDQIQQTSRFDDVLNPGTEATARMYAFGSIHTREMVKSADVNSPGFMRAPNEVPPYFALESAMDELAHAAGIDPVDFRLKNDTMTDPLTGVPFSSRSVRQCFERGAERFGWYDRNPEPSSMRAGDELVGYGCALAAYPTMMSPASARVRMNPSGHVELELAAHDVGTGAYTVMGMIAAEVLGLPLERIKVELGSSSFPPSPISGGSVTTASAGSAVHEACSELRDRLVEAAVSGNEGALAGVAPEHVRLSEGRLHGPDGRGMGIEEAIARTRTHSLEVRADWAHPSMPAKKIPSVYQGSFAVTGPVTDSHAMFAFGAEFVEVHINPRTRSMRVPRMLGVFAAGNVLNAKAGRSQLSGGMIWGLGSALHEATEVDPTRARYMNDNLAEYLVPVNADVRDLEIEVLPEEDSVVNPLGAKGIGELGIVGTAAAIANAVHHATGTRLRRLPLRMEDLL